MKDQSKTKQVLIHELVSLGQKIAEWEQSESERKSASGALRESQEYFKAVILLGKYLVSLEKVNTLDVELVLTGHRRLAHDLRGRVKELQEHHCARLNEMLVALCDGEKNILQTAPYISWDITAKTWEEFPVQQKWFAFGETLAHVKYLEGRGKVLSKNQNGTIAYSLA